jgi:DNA invertase Pin-like site-specific DNA recombinase
MAMHPRDLATWLAQIERDESDDRLRAAMAEQAQGKG